ncbi:MAG TPA: Tim44 domain-containing protein [Reyranella sp.]|nr:Tim44 domain-containing protein [Reyranella sp.]
MVLLVPAMADARVGGGTNSGSRGSRTDQAPAPTQTAPATKPVERSATPTQQAQARPAATPAAAQGGFFARNPFLSGMMGGLIGAGLIGMMFGGGFGGLGGAAGMLGLLIQLALIGGLGYLAYRLWKGRSAASAAASPAYAGGPRQTAEPMSMGRSMLAGVGGGGAAAAAAPAGIAIAPEDFSTFEKMLSDIQSAFSKGDLTKLRTMVTPEMVGYFSEQLSANASRGVENKVDAVKLEQGDLSESWSEGGIDYASVAMRFSMIDVTQRIADGTIVEGNPQVRTEATEVWTFLRSRGGNWILSAISQG